MASSALIVVDMLNPYDHEDADVLAESVAEIVDPLARLIERADEDLDVIYVNDNYDDWNSSQEELARRALDGRRPDLVEPVLPPDDASFVIKARHSVFYGTPLEHCDAVAHIDPSLAEAALRMMERNMRAEIVDSAHLHSLVR